MEGHAPSWPFALKINKQDESFVYIKSGYKEEETDFEIDTFIISFVILIKNKKLH